MIFKTYTHKGDDILLNSDQIVSVEESGVSGKWHGINSYIRLTTGKTVDCGESVMEVANKIEGAQ